MGAERYDGYTASVGIDVIFHSPEQEGRFLRALTGDDVDVCLAMERAVNAALGTDYDYETDTPQIYVHPAD